ncbi:MAG: hypothetical protein IJE14_02910 [Clostridia bacterium]|nr:hypothetical protein [Clostridia bacterium]
MDNFIHIGYNSFSDRADSIAFTGPAKAGADFIVCHFNPIGKTLKEECEFAAGVAKKIKDMGLCFVANFEFINFADHSRTADGFDWCNNPDGTHRLNLPEEYVRALASHGNLIGIMHDEMEHVLINTNLSITLDKKGRNHLPMFLPGDTKDVVEQGELCSKQFAEYADNFRSMGAPVFVGEHVFPVLYHTFARNGIIPNFKSQKESYSNLQFAVAAGAAMQYGTELWSCVDLWHKLTYPGHTADEMYHNLVFSYLTGVDRVYVEASNQFYDGDRLTDYGKAYKKFIDEYKDKPRSYTARDYKPEIGIIRYDDTYWGQGDPVAWRKILFGNKKIKPDKRAKEWIRVFRLITHGETSKHAINWNRISPWSLKPHRSFASMNGTAVFDDRVEKDKLSSLRLCFLCGYHISEKTLKAVGELVKENGLTAVTSKRFAPAHIKPKGGFTKVKDGKGCWIITNRFDSAKLKKAVSQFLGGKGEMTYRFGNEKFTLKISENGEAFEII